MALSGKQRRFLRAEAHRLEPVVSLGKEGVTHSLLTAVGEALLTHELIKLRVLESAPIERKEVAASLPGQVKAELVGLIGRIVILYKRHPNKPKLVLPREAKGGRASTPEPGPVATLDEDALDEDALDEDALDEDSLDNDALDQEDSLDNDA
jgi:RNA-binding protein